MSLNKKKLKKIKYKRDINVYVFKKDKNIIQKAKKDKMSYTKLKKIKRRTQSQID